MTPRLRLGILFAVLLAVVISGPCAISAQQPGSPRQPTRVPVTVALVHELDAPSRILRRADTSPYDVILLRADAADAMQLTVAVYDLIEMRAALGDTVGTTRMGMMRVRAKPGTSRVKRVELPWAKRVLADLTKADSKLIVGVGVVPAVEIWLPPQRKRS